MIVSASRQQAAQRSISHTTPSGAVTVIDTYMGTNQMEIAKAGLPKGHAPAAGGQLYPMAFLVRQAPNSVVQAHYHAVEQFQFFVGGGGRVGTHALEGVVVHYANPHSPYGPIAAGPSGVHYMTLRRGWDPGAQWMPEGAAALRQIPDRKHVALTSEPIDCRRGGQLELKDDVALTPVLPANDRGLGAWLMQLRPGARATGPDPALGGGQFWYLLSGSVTFRGAAQEQDACSFVTGDEAAVPLVAGEGGAELVVAQFPR